MGKGPNRDASKDRRRLYDRIAPVYDLVDLPFEYFRYRRLRRLLFSGLSGRILDAGTGTGRNMPYYPRGADVTAIDISRDMLRRALAGADTVEPMALCAILLEGDRTTPCSRGELRDDDAGGLRPLRCGRRGLLRGDDEDDRRCSADESPPDPGRSFHGLFTPSAICRTMAQARPAGPAPTMSTGLSCS